MENDIAKEEAQQVQVVKLDHFPKYETNPYVKELVIPKRNKVVRLGIAKANRFTLVDTDTGEEQFACIATTERVDKEEFVKIYKSQIQALFMLSQTAIRVFGYFMDSLPISNDMVIFDIVKAKKYTGYTTSSPIYKGIKELLANDFIARTHQSNLYFINPSIFFNGNRFIILKEYIKNKEESIKKIFN
jgi:hypothetical protein